MFFLKELPTRQMIDGYAGQYGANAETIATALDMMRRASLLVRRIDAYFAAQGFSQLRFLVLIVIDREPKRTSLRASEIADRLDVSRPVITRTLQNLLKDGLIAERGTDADKRAKRISLTPSGSDRLGALLPGYFRIIDSFIKPPQAPENQN